MSKTIKNSVLMIVIMTVLLGIIYPLLVTGIAQLIFPCQANGSIFYHKGKAVGSELIGQSFNSPKYFHGRPSAAGEGYDASASAGSNLGSTNPELLHRIVEQEKKVRSENKLAEGQKIPADLLTASGSGLDPHISPEAAYLQCERVAAARKVPVEKIKALLAKHVEKREFGVLGEPRVNVLQLNLALDKENPTSAATLIANDREHQ
ncbi:MAG: potassium-transporting ATPase subunit KdpC [Syntrophomonadaceae bacterium]|nr:potassium-transporting ATPase subunit KdpC [Syntrophomonadaceae bacterium]